MKLRILAGFVIAVLAALFCAPALLAVTGAFRSEWEIRAALAPVLNGTEGYVHWTLLPKSPSLFPMLKLMLDTSSYYVMFWNTVGLSLWICIGQLMVGLPAAWALSRFSFRGKKALRALYLVLMLMPFQVRMLPEYLVLSRLHLLDAHAGIILPAVFRTFPVFLMAQYFDGIPEPILEAARIDGAGAFTCFSKIGIPLGAPGITAVLLLSFLDSWNMIEQPMTFLKTKEKWPLSLFLPQISLQEAGQAFAAAFLMLLPALLLFAAGQDSLEAGITAGAVKD